MSCPHAESSLPDGNRALGRPCHLAAAILVLAVGVAGCGAGRPMQYYSIKVSAPTRSATSEPWPIVLLVGRFTAPHLYREDKLVYRTGTNELHTYEYHRWAEPPSEVLEDAFVSSLRASGRYRVVQLERSSTRGDYVVRGRLGHFDEVVGPPQVARVSFDVELYEVKTGHVVWTQTYSGDEPVHGKGVDAIVEAMNRNTERALAQVTAGLEQYFAAHPPH